MNVTPDSLSALSGTVISLLLFLFPLVPKAEAWWANLSSRQRQALNGLVTIVAGATVAGLSCGGVIEGVACDATSLLGYAGVVAKAVLANATTYVTLKHVLKA